MTEKFTCPRRTDNLTDRDRWEKGHSLLSQADELSCTYCGSLHPDRFMELVAAEWPVTPTDKGHKAYIGKPVTDKEKEAKRRQWRRDWRAAAFTACREDPSYKPSPEEVEAMLDKLWEDHGKLQIMAPAAMDFKFYFQHLSTEQQHEFVDRYNSGEMAVGYPGFFYTTPYFAVEGGS